MDLKNRFQRGPRSARVGGLLVASLCALLAGCDKPQAVGDANAIIVVVPDDQWPALQEDIEQALEPRAFTVRDERIFRVAQVDPDGPLWRDSRQFRQLLLIGEPGDEWVAQVLRDAGHQPTDLPAVVQATNVWARGQRVLALVLPPGASAATARPLLDQVGQTLVDDYRTWVQQRMFASGVDTARAQQLSRTAGFSLLTPAIYRHEARDANTHLFVNDQPDPAQLQRVVAVTRRPTAEVSMNRERILAWREALAEQHYQPPQLTDRERTERLEAGVQENRFFALQGVWSSPPGAWPAGGPFLTRAYQCPDGNTYLLDAWVYAPGREKYEFVFQLNTIMDSFRCAGQPAG
jgi:hypothetical protein